MENFRIVGGGRFNVKKFLNKNNDMRKKYCKFISLFLLFTVSHDRQIHGNWRRESKAAAVQPAFILSSPTRTQPPFVNPLHYIYTNDFCTRLQNTQESRQQKQP